ncbi:MAG: acyltransferase [Acholeplasma sp.]|nr:acyltransferase [Acholeplasma sp.]
MIKSIIDIVRFGFANPSKRAHLYQKKGVRMGENCQIFSGCSFGSEPYLISLGNRVKITNGCIFITHDGGVEVLRNLDSKLRNIDVFGKIEIGDNVFIGNKCIILPNVKIGDNVVIGAGSVITKNIPNNVVVAGIPAKIIKSIDDYKIGVLNKVDYTKNMNKKTKKDYLLKKYR